ncbi:MAG TPA: hypothetical protein PLE99_17810 [Candidatus Thiothrix moscowensis]|uniref:hypothetical protein n=1 Tax=unclassified Thiothrix TaxID=2636184 RepID=UPI0025CEBB11|nr:MULTISPECIES: hypothetical protein [unclassified Thiothrix]HRJ54622.1 hypothetical protein [Candidatus Thiothrix moscowensis]HRJ95018.1 hypothetical protein [Candidatus Thiothrix moscowensis]
MGKVGGRGFFLTPETVLANIAAQAKARRLAANLSHRTLAETSGVAEAPYVRLVVVPQNLSAVTTFGTSRPLFPGNISTITRLCSSP